MYISTRVNLKLLKNQGVKRRTRLYYGSEHGKMEKMKNLVNIL